MTFTIDTDQFLLDSLNRILKQVHLNNYKVGMFAPNQIPAGVKKLARGIIPGDFFNGAKARIIVLKAIDIGEVTDEDQMKITNFIKTTFFLSNESSFTTNDVYQVRDIVGGKKDKDDNEDTDAVTKAIYFFVKMELKA